MTIAKLTFKVLARDSIVEIEVRNPVCEKIVVTEFIIAADGDDSIVIWIMHHAIMFAFEVFVMLLRPSNEPQELRTISFNLVRVNASYRKEFAFVCENN